MKVKKVLSVILLLAVSISMFAMPVFADGTDNNDFTIIYGVLTAYNGSGGKVVIPNGVTRIDWEAFDGCSSLTSVTIPSSVKSIGYSAFESCQSLTNIIMQSGVTNIEDEAFLGCNNLTSINIPNSVKSIGYSAFCGCSSLKSVNLPNSITSIDIAAFDACSSLTSVTIPSGITSIGASEFNDCSSLKSVTIPSSITSIGNDAFYNCSSLTSVTIPESVTSIGNEVFDECYSLTSVTIPKSVTSIGDYAFSGCSALPSVIIPSSVTSIGNSAFLGCNALTSITIPSSVTSIGDSAFGGCGFTCNSGTNFTIYGAIGSVAQTYAGQNSITFSDSSVSLENPRGVNTSTTTSSGVKLSWNAVSSATGYQVYRATSSTGTFSLVSTVTTNSYTDSSVNWGKTCYYKIRAYTTSGKTIYSAYSPVVSAKLTLEVPANLKTTKASSTTLKLTWNSVSGANGYEVYFSPSTYCWDPYTLVVSTSSLSYTMTGISAGKSYYNFYCFKVRAYRTVNGVKVYSDYTPVVIFKY